MKNPSSIIKTVRLTEKTALQSDGSGKYVFEVAVGANKAQIKGAVETFFGKTVVKVNTSNHVGKAKRSRTASAGKTSDWKKAVVTLAQGQTIEIA
jgi:large subunit ribosomal protein L23